MNGLLAVFGLGGGEIVLLLALILILFEQFWKHRRSDAIDPRSWFKWGADWANVITFLLLGILAMVILSLFAR